MSIGQSALTQKRVSILHRYFAYVCDPTHEFGADDLIALRHRFAVNAKVQKIPESHKWILKLTAAFENMTSLDTYSSRRRMRETINDLYNDNRAMFAQANPAEDRIKLYRIN